MRIFRHYHDIPEALKGAVVALGNFDGVHRGHQALIATARRMAEERNAPLGVIAFEPHPQEFFRPSAQSFRLTPFRTKSRLIAELGVDALFALHFDGEMAKKTPQDFVLDVLVEGLAVGAVAIGADFQFGRQRAGNATVLAYMGEMEGFEVAVLTPVAAEGEEKISSTAIRKALEAGRPDIAASLLDHWWSAEARVEQGERRGRELGFPTANMRIEHSLQPAFGVYAVRATVIENDRAMGRYDGVANFGIRPMYKSETPLLETHLFDFDGDLYGKHLSVEFVHYLRPEAAFDSEAALRAQMKDDASHARAALDHLKDR